MCVYLDSVANRCHYHLFLCSKTKIYVCSMTCMSKCSKWTYLVYGCMTFHMLCCNSQLLIRNDKIQNLLGPIYICACTVFWVGPCVIIDLWWLLSRASTQAHNE